jgi:hypothetical protein
MKIMNNGRQIFLIINMDVRNLGGEKLQLFHTTITCLIDKMSHSSLSSDGLDTREADKVGISFQPPPSTIDEIKILIVQWLPRVQYDWESCVHDC